MGKGTGCVSGVVGGGGSDGICEEIVSGGDVLASAVALDPIRVMCFGCDAGGGVVCDESARFRSWC